jgi:capsular exopolysaccharide synthesis family protein
MQNGNSYPDTKVDVPASSLDLDQIWHVIREKAWLIALCGLLGILGGLAYIHHTPLTYYAQAVLEVDPEPVKVIGYNDVQEAKDPISDEMAQTLRAVFTSRQFAEEVIKENDLLNVKEFLPQLANGQMPTLEDAAGALSGMEQVTLPPETRFINVGVKHSDPMMAKELADMLAKHYIERASQERTDKAKLEIDYLNGQAKIASNNLKLSEDAVQKYIRDKSDVSLVDSHDTVNSELKSKIGQLSGARQEAIQLAADDEEAQKEKDNPDALLEIPSVANDPTIMQYKQMIDELKERIRVLSLRYYDPHPKMILAHTQLADAEASLKQAVLNIPAVIHSRRLAAEARVQEFSDALSEQEKAALHVDDDKIDYDVLTRNVEANQALYDGILSRIKESTVATGMDSTGIHPFEWAQLPVVPMQARKSKTLEISLIGGLIMGLVLAFGLHMMDSSLKTVDQAEDLLGLTVLAAVPRQTQSRLRESALALIKAPGSPVAEAFRSLRTAVYLAGKVKGRNIVLFTSTLAGEGKTFCSTNYATALAQQGLRTLIIDADLRSPMVGTVLLADRKLPGLLELLSRKIDSAAAIHESDIENLWVMPSGELVSNPAELLARSDMAELVRDLATKYERIVIDTAPVTAVSDTLLLLEHAQAICLVAQASKTPRKWILRAIKLIAEAGSRPTGVILNQMPMRMAGAYSYYPGRYGEPEVYGAGAYARASRERTENEEAAPTEPRF